MDEAETSSSMSTGLSRVMERARKEPHKQMLALAHHIDVEALARSYRRIRNNAVVGIDGVTKEAYGANLEGNLRALHERLETMRYRHKPIRRVRIPKEGGKTRPIGISSMEDKIVQGALCELLGAIYEQEFLECSYGFRPLKKAHDALKALNRAVNGWIAKWVLEVDIKSFFDSMVRPILMEMLGRRIGDKSILRLVGKCLHVGVLDGEEVEEPELGTVQGSSLSPLLGNVYLHCALDVWFEKEVKPRLRGKSVMIRYADDITFGFEREDDARRVMEALGKRLERFGLSSQPEKTRLIDFRRPLKTKARGKGPSTFDFLGFSAPWSADGRFRMNQQSVHKLQER